MISEFFAVTMTSIYRVRDHEEGGAPYPEAKKIAVNGNSKLGIGSTLKDGTLLAVCNRLVMFIPEGGGITSYERHIELVNTRYWGGNSSYIVALFLDRESAESCHRAHDLEPCDPRWIDSTRHVLKEIGDDHPLFVICRWEGLALLCAIESTAA